MATTPIMLSGQEAKGTAVITVIVSNSVTQVNIRTRTTMQRGIKAGATMPRRGQIVEAQFLVRKGIIAGTAMPSA